MRRTLRDRVDLLEQRSQASRPGFCPVVHYVRGEPLPDLADPPDGRALFLIPDNGREPSPGGAARPGGNA